MKMSGAEILLQALGREGVEVIFGYPGGCVLPIYDALYGSDIRHILTRHEQGAAHAADGYARATGRTGVCLATSGPGATNLVTGIATAYMDSIPMVVLTGQVPTSMLGKDSFQEADITGITLPVTKHSFLVKDARELPRVIKEAFHIASTGRPGPVLVDMPKDVLQAEVQPKWPESVDIPSYRPTYTGHPKQIAEAAKAILHAVRPVLLIGGGVISSGASDEVLALAESLGAPVATTLMGIGGFPSEHPLQLGMLGMHGTAAANYAVSGSDLLVSIGSRFDDRATGNTRTFASAARMVHIDIDPAEIGKNVKAHIPIVGDIKLVLSALIAEIGSRAPLEGRDASGWLETVKRWQGTHPLGYEVTGELKPQYVVEQLSEATKGEAIITTEVGQNQMWTAQFFRFRRPRSFISSGGLGTMGFGLPAAIGAQVAFPDSLVIDIAGDGSIQMNVQELATVATYRLPVKIAILNNGFLGMVRQWQEMFYDRRYSSVHMPDVPDFVKLAEAYGIKGLRATTAEEVRAVIDEALATPGPVLMDFRVSQEENVFPMVPAGGSISEMIGGREP